jgi:hypothetical protein
VPPNIPFGVVPQSTISADTRDSISSFKATYAVLRLK